MTELTVSPAVKGATASLGACHDTEGNVVPNDSVVSGTWSLADVTVGSIDGPTDQPTCHVSLNGAGGSVVGAFAGVDSNGNSVTGSFTLTVAVGPATEVDVALTPDPPA
jgi:hypothetical protein